MSTLLDAHGLSKRYGGVQALEDVSLRIDSGDCVALMGGNGAGKSTLVAIISGLQKPDAGELRVDGQPVSFRGSFDARGHGIETVYQDLALCDNLSAAGNLFLGREQVRRFGPLRIVDRGAMERQTRDTLDALGVDLPGLRAAAAGYSGGQRQALSFARAMHSSSRLLILDEPTAALGVAERERVLKTVRRLRDDGRVAVLLVTHNLEEMRQLAKRVIVLRHGHCVADVDAADADDDAIVGSITGSRR